MKNNRRQFIRKAAGIGIAAGASVWAKAGVSSDKHIELQQNHHAHDDKRYSANDKIRLGAIGAGIIGFYNIDTALSIHGVELVAASDLYDGRLTRIKEKYGNHISTTRDYREILNRKDIDAVLIATPDHWHDIMSIEAMKAGKAVYCEKPMVQKIEQGKAVIDTEKKTKAVYQVGSQGSSSILMGQAKKLYEAGEIGELVLVEAAYDRHSTLGAWQYSIPPDASPQTVDWDRFLGSAPKVPYDPIRFFRWRNYQDYGTGIAGDLFVHLFSWLHYIVSSDGPNRIFATGGLKYWKDGRNVPDLMTAVVDYPATAKHPAFHMQIRVNFVAGGDRAEGLKLVGTEGSMFIGWDTLTVKKTPLPNVPEYGGYDSLFTFPESVQKDFIERHKAKYYRASPRMEYPDMVYKTPAGYDDRRDHWANFIGAMREGIPVNQNSTYGLRAAAPSICANISYFENKVVKWDPVKMALG